MASSLFMVVFSHCQPFVSHLFADKVREWVDGIHE